MAAPGTPLVLSKAAKYYGQVLGLSDVSLTVDGGIVGLLGPNGAGKSTLMRLAAGMARPTRGSVRVFGGDAWADREARRRIGYCPEHEGAHDELTALEWVTALAELAGVTHARAPGRAAEVLADVGLEAASGRRLGTFSKGMRQRAKLAQAMAHEPDLLLLDEPLTGCDPLARAQIIERIRALGAAGKTVLLSSHVLYEIEALTDQIVLIHRGQVLAEGNIYRLRELIDEHPHRIRVGCARPRDLARALLDGDGDGDGEDGTGVTRIDLGKDFVEVETHLPDRLYDAIPLRARAAGIAIASLVSPDNNIQSVFDYLTERKT
jgi:ABC-2 type transport system ATP-binding protein